ncbi:MAG: methanogenesis marker 8 protein [Methanomassiliicoccales archaeon]
MTEHLLEIAKALVLVRDGEIEVLSDPKVEVCPLRSRLYGCERETRETVERVLRSHMEELGMFGPDRVLELDEKPVSFGASEITMDAMDEGMVDAAVVVCEGAGTIVVDRPEVLQAVGAHMTGLIRTDPIREIQEGLEERGVILLDREGTIDQVAGYVKAVNSGFHNVVVTITGHRAFEARKLWEMGRVSGRPIIFPVHNTGIDREQAETLVDHCDIIWACASDQVREVAGEKAKVQIGVSIPVFAITDLGKRLVLNRALHFEDTLVIHRAGLPHAPQGKQPRPLF